MLRRRAIFSLVLGIALVTGACQDVNAPASALPAPGSGDVSALLGGTLDALLDTEDTVFVLQRKKALSDAITVTRTIGAAGGTITIPAAGLTVKVPEDAVSSPTEFTVTALAGHSIAYEFGPHGMEFAKPLKFVQDLNVSVLTEDKLQYADLEGGYFEDTSSLLNDLLRAVVEELLKATVDSEKMTVRFDIKHFSGYLVAVEYQD